MAFGLTLKFQGLLDRQALLDVVSAIELLRYKMPQEWADGMNGGVGGASSYCVGVEMESGTISS